MLSRVAHAVVALQQIMDAQPQFLDSSARSSRFVLDPDYGFLYLLERSESTTDLRFAFTCLQRRVENGNQHLLTYFRSFRQTLTSEDGSDRLSSADSTISEVLKEFGSQHPLKEIYRLPPRSDSALRAALIDDDARGEAIRKLGEESRARFHRSRSMGRSGRDYYRLCHQYGVLLLSPLMFVHVGQMAPTKSSGRARSWWSLPEFANLVLSGWESFVECAAAPFPHCEVVIRQTAGI
jgi:hypothetical protein